VISIRHLVLVIIMTVIAALAHEVGGHHHSDQEETDQDQDPWVVEQLEAAIGATSLTDVIASQIC